MRLRSIGLIVTLALGILVAPLAARAQPPGKVYRIGYLHPGSVRSATALDAFRAGLRDFGWVEGQNILIEYRWAEGKYELLPELAAELVQLNVDLIITTTTPSVLAAQKASKTIPIVFVGVGDPVAQGLVASLARPGGNLTGTTTMLPELTAKGLELLREAAPRISRVAILYNLANPAYGPLMKGIEVPARRLGVEVQLVGVQTPNELERAFAAMKKERADGLLVHRDPVFHADFRKRIVELAAEHRLPAIYRYVEAVEAGGLMGYGPNTSDMWRRAATYVDKILKGAKPADLPVEQPTRFELVINLKTAKTLGITIPPSVLLRADHVIQ